MMHLLNSLLGGGAIGSIITGALLYFQSKSKSKTSLTQSYIDDGPVWMRQNDKLIKDRERYAQQVLDLQKKVGTMSDTIDRLNGTINAQRGTIHGLKQQVTKQNKTVEKQNETIETQNGTIKRLADEVHQLSQKLDKLSHLEKEEIKDVEQDQK